MAIAGVREMYPTNVTVLFRRMGQLSRNMARRWSTLMFLVGMVIASAAAAGDARAQGITAFGSAESGGDDVSVFLLGVSFVTARDEGLHPTAALQAYRLSYPSTDGTREVWAVTPSVGLRYRVSGGYLEGRVGYSFQNDDTDVPLVGAFMSGGRSGLTSSAHAEIWGSDPVALQGIASVNWRSEYLWTRGRALYRLARLNPGAISVGGDLGWQGFMGGDREYDALTYGPVVHWATGRGAYLALGAGWKRNNYEVGDETVGYAKLELVLSR